MLMAYLKIIWGFGAALLHSERKDLFQITGLISLVGSFSTVGGQAAILS